MMAQSQTQVERTDVSASGYLKMYDPSPGFMRKKIKTKWFSLRFQTLLVADKANDPSATHAVIDVAQISSVSRPVRENLPAPLGAEKYDGRVLMVLVELMTEEAVDPMYLVGESREMMTTWLEKILYAKAMYSASVRGEGPGTKFSPVKHYLVREPVSSLPDYSMLHPSVGVRGVRDPVIPERPAGPSGEGEENDEYVDDEPAPVWTGHPVEPKNARYAYGVENDEGLTAFYKRFFAPFPHGVFGTIDPESQAPVVISIIRESVPLYNGSATVNMIRALVWTPTGLEKVYLATKAPFKSFASDLAKILPDLGLSHLKKAFAPLHSHPDVVPELVKLEKLWVPTQFKIGVVYVGPDQTDEDLIFANDVDPEDVDHPFNVFLAALGDRTPLLGFEGYKGGLDIKSNGTGTHSVVGQCFGNSIMYHVSTYLPHDDSGQELKRKRHIGNDVACIVFVDVPVPPTSDNDTVGSGHDDDDDDDDTHGKKDSEDSEILEEEDPYLGWDPNTIRCKFQHAVAVIRPSAERDGYVLGFAHKGAMNEFGPPLPTSYWHEEELEEMAAFINLKLLNGERSAIISSPLFEIKYKRTLDIILRGLIEDAPEEGESNKSDGTVPADDLWGEYENGVPPGGNELTQNPIFATEPLVEAIPGRIVCWDLWGGHFIYATGEGIFLVPGFESSEQAPPRKISPTRAVQMSVIDALGVVVVRTAKSGLRVLFLHSIGPLVDVPVAHTKKCSVYEVAQPGEDVLLVTGVKKHLLLHKWAEHGFELLPTRIDLENAPLVVHFVGSSLLVGTAEKFVWVDLDDEYGVSGNRVLYTPEEPIPAEGPIEVFPFSDEGRALVCYGDQAVLVDGDSSSVDSALSFGWSSLPVHLACYPPVIVGVMIDYIEVRSLVNGSLLQHLCLPGPISLLSSQDGPAVGTHPDPDHTDIFLLYAIPAPQVSASQSRMMRVRGNDVEINFTQAGDSDGKDLDDGGEDASSSSSDSTSSSSSSSSSDSGAPAVAVSPKVNVHHSMSDSMSDSTSSSSTDV